MRKRTKYIEEIEDYNFGFYYIEGYTEVGEPYGITIEEAMEQGLMDNYSLYEEYEDMPFWYIMTKEVEKLRR